MFGLAAGAFIVWLLTRTQLATLHERISNKDTELNGLNAGRDQTLAETQTLRLQLQEEIARRSSAEAKAAQALKLESEGEDREQRINTLQADILGLTSSLADSEARRQEEVEKLGLLSEVRTEFGIQFKNLANEILEDKSKRFTEQNKSNIEALLNPLAQKILAFEKRVEETYDKESKQRFSLETEIKNLRDLNTQISQDAINLTNALKGQSKTQGAWGEIILERVLEMSGLVKGREYDVQVTLTSEEGKRSCPDVIIYLPENRHLVIDSKVNLVAYERYCTLADGVEREAELKKNINAFRKHVSELDLKKYQDHYKLNSLDFVLMFVPIEGAFMIAVQNDERLFDQAFEKNLVIVSPSTLLATMRTIHNLWRQEDQNRNALKIAKQAGRLYDKFAAFVTDLHDIGRKLQAAQDSHENARMKLISGRGNIVSRIENIRQLGARATKKLPQDFVDDAMEDESEDAGKAPLVLPQPAEAQTEIAEEDELPLLRRQHTTGQ
jgi:DNA recombination protein RmuC